MIPSMWAKNEETIRNWEKRTGIKATQVRTFHRGNLGFYYGKSKGAREIKG